MEDDCGTMEEDGSSFVIGVLENSANEVTLDGSLRHVIIDATSVQNLELIKPLPPLPNLAGPSNIKRSLFDILRTTRTIGGTRLLRANILQPLKDIELINARLDCLDELMGDKQLFSQLNGVLREFPISTDRVLYNFCCKPNKVANAPLVKSVFILENALDALPRLSKVLQDAKSSLLSSIYNSV